MKARIPLYNEQGEETKKYLEVDVRRLMAVLEQGVSPFIPSARIVSFETKNKEED